MSNRNQATWIESGDRSLVAEALPQLRTRPSTAVSASVDSPLRLSISLKIPTLCATTLEGTFLPLLLLLCVLDVVGDFDAIFLTFFQLGFFSYECKLCLTLHNNEGNYLAHTQGKRHQTNLAKRAAREAKEAPAQPQPHKRKVSVRKTGLPLIISVPTVAVTTANYNYFTIFFFFLSY